MKLGDRRIEIHKGPDRLGRYEFTLFWVTDYLPGRPDDDYGLVERGQNFFDRLDRFKDVPQVDRRVIQ